MKAGKWRMRQEIKIRPHNNEAETLKDRKNGGDPPEENHKE